MCIAQYCVEPEVSIRWIRNTPQFLELELWVTSFTHLSVAIILPILGSAWPKDAVTARGT